jgi:hypothetical protein
MPLFLLHDIFPKGPGSGWFVIGLLVLLLLWIVTRLLFVVGLVVAVARGRERLGPLNLRGVKPPSLGLWLASLVLCTLASALYTTDSLSWVPSLVLYSGSGIAGIFDDELLPMAVLSALVSSVHWTLMLTGARALWTVSRRAATTRATLRQPPAGVS